MVEAQMPLRRYFPGSSCETRHHGHQFCRVYRLWNMYLESSEQSALAILGPGVCRQRRRRDVSSTFLVKRTHLPHQ
jgi:hypothetical protein